MTSRTKMIAGKKYTLVSSTMTKTAALRESKSIKKLTNSASGRAVKFSKTQAKREHANYGVYVR